jgi:hypothetical protein
MPNVLFTRRLVAVDADQFKRVEFKKIISNDGKNARLEGTATTGIAVNPYIPQQQADGQKETTMNVQELTSAFAALPVDAQAQFIAGLSAAVSAPKHTAPMSTLDRLLASANTEQQRTYIRNVYAEAQRKGITVPPDGRKLQVSEVSQMMKASDRFLPGDTESKIRFKTDLAAAGFME